MTRIDVTDMTNQKKLTEAMDYVLNFLHSAVEYAEAQESDGWYSTFKALDKLECDVKYHTDITDFCEASEEWLKEWVD